MTEYKREVWRVNARTQFVTHEPVPASWTRLGGRGLLARILLDEVDAVCDPLGPGNKLIFAPGLLVGHMLSSTDRISIGGKSPLTGGVKEANAGGRTGLHMATMGIHALIIEDMPDGDDWWVLHLSMNGAKWEQTFRVSEDPKGLSETGSVNNVHTRRTQRTAPSIPCESHGAPISQRAKNMM